MILPATPEPGAPQEPLLSVGTVVSITTGIVAVAVAFGLPLNDVQQGTILALIGFTAPLIVAFIARGKVWAPRTVRALAVEAAATGRINTEPTEARTDAEQEPWPPDVPDNTPGVPRRRRPMPPPTN
jgi:hypothetical protein